MKKAGAAIWVVISAAHSYRFSTTDFGGRRTKVSEETECPFFRSRQLADTCDGVFYQCLREDEGLRRPVAAQENAE